MRKKQKMRSISVSKEVERLESEYIKVLTDLSAVARLEWPKVSAATLYKIGLRDVISDLKGLTNSMKKDLANVK